MQSNRNQIADAGELFRTHVSGNTERFLSIEERIFIDDVDPVIRVYIEATLGIIHDSDVIRHPSCCSTVRQCPIVVLQSAASHTSTNVPTT